MSLTADQFWQAQPTWSIDESNVTGLASDGNTGLDDAHPLLTIGELLARVGSHWLLTIPVTVRWLSDATTTAVDASCVMSTSSSRYLLFKGVPTVVQSGFLGAATAPGAGNAAPIVEDLAVTAWTVSDANRGRLIRKVGGNVRGWVSKDLGGSQARTSWCSDVAESGSSIAENPAAFAPGDQYEVLALPSFPVLSCPNRNRNALRFLMLNINSGVPLSLNRAMESFFILCSFRGQGNFNTFGNTSLANCCFMGGAIFGGNTITPNFCLFGGVSQAINLDADWGGNHNTFQAARFIVSHSSNVNRSGTLHVYDSPSTFVELIDGCDLGLDAVDGGGNTGLVTNIRDPGCHVNLVAGPTGWTALTSAPKPIGLCGATFDYADLVPGASLAINAAKNAGYYV
jgi:hypothetical protein